MRKFLVSLLVPIFVLSVYFVYFFYVSPVRYSIISPLPDFLFISQNSQASTLNLWMPDINDLLEGKDGLEGDGVQYTTAYDLLVMTNFALSNFPKFAKIAQTFEYTIPKTNTHEEFYMQNETNLLSTYPGVKGCLLYTSPSPRDGLLSRMPSSA